MKSSSRTRTRRFVEIDDLPSLYVDCRKHANEDHQPCDDTKLHIASKNDIFSSTQKILKPAIKMTPEELNQLRAGRTPSSVSSPILAMAGQNEESRTSITVPVSVSIDPSPLDGNTPGIIQSSHFKNSDRVPDAYLKMASTSISISSKHAVHHVRPKLPFTQCSSSPLKIGKNEQKIQHLLLPISARTSDSIQLSFLPVPRNLIGEGRYSEVYLGYYRLCDTPPDEVTPANNDLRLCAVKRLHQSDDALALGLAEISILTRLGEANSNIISLKGFKDESYLDLDQMGLDYSCSQNWDHPAVVNPSEKVGSLFSSKPPRLLLVFELHENGDLWSWAQKNWCRISKSLWLKWGRELANALTTIHNAGIIHHDIKPHNILCTDVLDVILSDFGNAAFVPEVIQTRTYPLSPVHFEFENSCFSFHSNMFEKEPAERASLSPLVIPGTPISPASQSLSTGVGRVTVAYCAPELVRPGSSYSFPADVYSLGVTFYALISGADPFSLARSSTQLLLGIQRGFFASGLQKLGYYGSPGQGGIVGDPSDRNWRFPNGEPVPNDLVCLICDMLSLNPEVRPTAAMVQAFLEAYEH